MALRIEINTKYTYFTQYVRTSSRRRCGPGAMRERELARRERKRAKHVCITQHPSQQHPSHLRLRQESICATPERLNFSPTPPSTEHAPCISGWNRMCRF